MNDEEFARSVLIRAFPSGDEPAIGLDIGRMVHDGRRASHARTAGLATGGAALAGAVAMTAWGVAGLGQDSPTPGIGAGAGASLQKAPGVKPIDTSDPAKTKQLLASRSAGDSLKSDSLTPCSTTVDLESVVRAALPAGSTIASSSATTCKIKGGQERSIGATLELTHPYASLTVSLESLVGTAAPASMDPANAKAKKSIATSDGDPVPTCAAVDQTWQSCALHLVKGGSHVSVVTLFSKASGSHAVRVEASAAAAEPVPFTDAALIGLTHDIAVHTS